MELDPLKGLGVEAERTRRDLHKYVSTMLERIQILVEAPDSLDRTGDKDVLHITEAVVLSAVAISAVELQAMGVQPMEMQLQEAILDEQMVKVFKDDNLGLLAAPRNPQGDIMELGVNSTTEVARRITISK